MSIMYHACMITVHDGKSRVLHMLKNSKNTKPGAKHELLRRKREKGRRGSSQGCLWAPDACVVRPGAGPRHQASWARGGPLVSLRYLPVAFYLEIFILNFLEFSGQ